MSWENDVNVVTIANMAGMELMMLNFKSAQDLSVLTMKLWKELPMTRWMFTGITDRDETVRVDNPAIPIICNEWTAKDVAVDLVLKHESRYGLWFRHCFCQCLDKPELSYTI
jgi:hypothetical protein